MQLHPYILEIIIYKANGYSEEYTYYFEEEDEAEKFFNNFVTEIKNSEIADIQYLIRRDV